MMHLDLSLAAFVLLASVAGAVLVRVVASFGEGRARDRTRRIAAEVWRERRPHDEALEAGGEPSRSAQGREITAEPGDEA